MRGDPTAVHEGSRGWGTKSIISMLHGDRAAGEVTQCCGGSKKLVRGLQAYVVLFGLPHGMRSRLYKIPVKYAAVHLFQLRAKQARLADQPAQKEEGKNCFSPEEEEMSLG